MSRTDHHLRNSAPCRTEEGWYVNGVLRVIVSKPVLGKREHIAQEVRFMLDEQQDNTRAYDKATATRLGMRECPDFDADDFGITPITLVHSTSTPKATKEATMQVQHYVQNYTLPTLHVRPSEQSRVDALHAQGYNDTEVAIIIMRDRNRAATIQHHISPDVNECWREQTKRGSVGVHLDA